MESASQSGCYPRTLKSGEVVMVYGDIGNGNFMNPAKLVSVETQTDLQPFQRVGAASSSTSTTTASQQTNDSTKIYNTIGTETDLTAVGNRKTLETLLRWALTLCASECTFTLPAQQAPSKGPSESRKVRDTKTKSSQGRRSARGSSRRGRPRRTKSRTLGLVPRSSSSNVTGSTSTEHISATPDEDSVFLMRDIKVFVPHEMQTLNEDSGPIDCDEEMATVEASRKVRPDEGEIPVIREERTRNKDAVPLTPSSPNTVPLTPASPHKVAPAVSDPEAGRPLLAGQRWLLPKPALSPVQTNTTFVAVPTGQPLNVPFAAVPCIQSSHNPLSAVPTAPSSSFPLIAQSGALRNPTTEDCEQKYKCSECCQYFLSQSELDIHLQNHFKESGSKPFMYECELCNKTFSFPSLLKMHLKTHYGENPSPVKFHHQCPVCDKSFAFKSSLRCHMRTHSGEKPFECPTCHKRFTQRGNLSDHMRIHTGEAPHACPHCPKRFTHQTTLRRHVRLHTGSRYECPYCEKKYCQENGLKVHMRSKHTGERPFLCDFCDSRFTAKNILKKHMESHLKEKAGVSKS